ncbi:MULTISPECIES: ATP-grasp domain-containing protein [unclassified Oceanispirochaeta]|nr:MULTISPECIES: ATP-grasp domain-containing protein [unclassified Oceanispirochaeta]MBF9016328.1 ATP-grasp domain-containing protein [Oceanispirochaeta sp. M2]NPD72791.1 ATP-grasp domain-containing protein [Oceanispirochaeta sp. M1]
MQNKEKYNPATVRSVSDSLESGGHNVTIIDGDMHVIDSLQEFMPRVLEGERMGIVFNMAYGIQGESRYTHIPSMLEMLGIPYVGSTPAGHALALDKVITKIIMQKHGIPTPQFWVFNNGDENLDDVIFPVIVKPKMEAVSFGLKVVNSRDDLRDAITFIVNEFQQQALVEEFIRGREFCIGLLGNTPVEAFPVLEIDLENDPDAIQTVDDKKSRPRRKICPAALSEDIASEMTRLSIDAFKALGLRDFARVDIRLDENNNIYLLEINSMASLGKTGSYYHGAIASGYDYNSLVNKMLEVSALRYFAESHTFENKNDNRLPAHVRIRGFLRSRQESLEKTLKTIVNLNSYVRNCEGVNTLGSVMVKELSALRFSHKSFPNVETGNSLYFSNTGDDNIDILLLGNLDNDVKVSRQEYFQLQGHKLYGTGIWEHKGGLVVLLGALQALRFIRRLKQMKIGILLTSDDVLHGRVSKELVREYSRRSRCVLGLHGAFLNGGVVTSRSGAASYSLSSNLLDKSDASHVAASSRVFNKVVGDILALSDHSSSLVIAPGTMQFESNITEPYAHGDVKMRIRFSSLDQFKDVDSKIRKIISSRKSKNLVDFHLEGGLGRPQMDKSLEVEEVYLKLKNIADRLDIRLKEEHRWSSADICTAENRFRIDGLGPVGIKPQDQAEYILKHSLVERMTLLAMGMMELSSK